MLLKVPVLSEMHVDLLKQGNAYSLVLLIIQPLPTLGHQRPQATGSGMKEVTTAKQDNELSKVFFKFGLKYGHHPLQVWPCKLLN